MQDKILTTYKYVRDSNLLTIIHRVVGKIDGNNHFPDPPAALHQIRKELPDFIAALTNASYGDQEKVAIKRAKRLQMIGLLEQLAGYITAASQGNRAILLSSGFALNREKGDTSMSEIKELKITAERSGEAITQIKKVTGARSYMHQYTVYPATDNSQWISEVVAETSYTFTRLQSQEKYVFRVIAIGVKGQRVLSPHVSRVIQ